MGAGFVVVYAVLGAVAGALVLVPGAAHDPRTMGAAAARRSGQWSSSTRCSGQLAANSSRSRLGGCRPISSCSRCLLAVSVVDIRLYRIPDRFVFPGLGITIVLVVIASFIVLPSASDHPGALSATRASGCCPTSGSCSWPTSSIREAWDSAT